MPTRTTPKGTISSQTGSARSSCASRIEFRPADTQQHLDLDALFWKEYTDLFVTDGPTGHASALTDYLRSLRERFAANLRDETKVMLLHRLLSRRRVSLASSIDLPHSLSCKLRD